ncbi:MAG: hypothetical protein EYC70_14420 [Planctomycetota bacterium]|nr:MAG: hypothetical protein EYC70_14420 [Planctomycetota bacterium]
MNSPSEQDLGSPGRDDVLLELVEWGRLVDVADSSGVVVMDDVLIREDVQPDQVNYEIFVNPVTEEETLTVLEPAGTPAFTALLDAARASLSRVQTKGPADPPPYSLIPRNAAIRLTFSELVNPATVNSTTIRIWTGNPPAQALPVRYLVQNDSRRGKGVVVLDPTISARQSAQLGLPQNSVGFPASFDAVNDNLMIRIPTEVNITFGQPQVLRNLSDTRSIRPSADDPIVADQAGNPVVVRSLRTGNGEDPNNGFLMDAVRPSMLAVADVIVAEIEAGATANTFNLTYSVDAVHCRELTPKTRDVFEIGASVSVVVEVLSSGNPLALEVRVNVLEGTLTPGSSSVAGRMTTRYTAQDALRQACYLAFTPQAAVSASNPITLAPFSSVTIRFDESVDPTTVLSMHSFVVAAYEANATDATAPYLKNGPESVGSYIDRQRGFHNPRGTGQEYGGRVLFGPIEVSNGGKDFTLTPLAGFTDPNGDGAQFYAVAVRDGLTGIRDLAGNPLSSTGFVAGTPLAGVDPELTIRVDPTGGTVRDKYLSLRGLGIDEDGDGLSEYRGQFDVVPGKLTGRMPATLSLVADPSTLLSAVPLGTQPVEPLTPAGAVVQAAYRPHDFALSYFDPNDYNLDIAGMAWSPVGGVVLDDGFDRFRISVAHSTQLPDELLNPAAGSPYFPFSGLFFGGEFNDNILGFPEFNEEVVSDGEYNMRAINLFQTASGTAMLPFPSFSATYTWRDTAIPQSVVGATGGIGSPPATQPGAGFWPAENVPSVGLPLLVRWSTFPRGNFLGINQLQTSNMLPQAANNGFNTPAFRVFSYGGEDASGRFIPVIPDNSAFGGTRPSGGYLNGLPTQPNDQNLYWLQVTAQVKVSRVFTHWFDLGTTLGAPGDAIGMLVEPDVVNQNQGTEVVVELRGSAAVLEDSGLNEPSPLRDADLQFDDYGDFVVLPGNTASVSTPGPFTGDLRQLEGQPQPYRYIQVRFSFVSDVEQNLQAFLDGFGFAWDF